MKNVRQVLFEDSAKLKFPHICIATVFIDDIEVGKSSSWLSKRMDNAVKYVRGKYADTPSLSKDPIIVAYRDFFKRIKIDPTKVRPSGEALIRMILKRGRLPIINHIVDSMNIVSSMTGLSLSTFDADKVVGDVIVRIARHGEEYIPHGSSTYVTEGGELVIADFEKILCLYPYRDTIATRITEQTRNVILQVHGVPRIDKNSVFKAADDTRTLIANQREMELPTINITSS